MRIGRHRMDRLGRNQVSEERAGREGKGDLQPTTMKSCVSMLQLSQQQMTRSVVAKLFDIHGVLYIWGLEDY